MAWISVHESIVGDKLRNLRKRLNCSQWEAVGLLCSLWLWGLKNARPDGLIPFADRRDIADELAGTSAGSSISTEQAVDALIAAGWIDETENGLSLHDWDEWQEQWYKAKTKREYDKERKRQIRMRGAAAKPEEQPPPQDCPVDVPTEIPATIDHPHPPESKYSNAFEMFWSEYPRKDEKAGAYKCFQTRLKDGFSEEEMILAAKSYAAKCLRDHTERRYIKLARTFLGPNTPFLDFVPADRSTDPGPQEPDRSNPFARFGGGQ